MRCAARALATGECPCWAPRCVHDCQDQAGRGLECCRAKFIVGSAALLAAKEGGGAAWLQGLRSVPYAEASEALCSLPGVGPKVRAGVPSAALPCAGVLRSNRGLSFGQVAACVCLFSLDKHAAIPVDTHVWQLAARYYTPQLKGVGVGACCRVVQERFFMRQSASIWCAQARA